MAITAGNPFPSASEPASGGAGPDPMNQPSASMPETAAGSPGSAAGTARARPAVADNEMLSRVVQRRLSAHSSLVSRNCSVRSPSRSVVEDTPSCSRCTCGAAVSARRSTVSWACCSPG